MHDFDFPLLISFSTDCQSAFPNKDWTSYFHSFHTELTERGNIDVEIIPDERNNTIFVILNTHLPCSSSEWGTLAYRDFRYHRCQTDWSSTKPFEEFGQNLLRSFWIAPSPMGNPHFQFLKEYFGLDKTSWVLDHSLDFLIFDVIMYEL